MIVLSLFDGISCGQVALERSGIKVEKYFASEIDKYAIKVTQANYPNTIQLGDIRNIKGKDLPQIDLLIGGSPCQGFSFAGKRLNFDDPRSKLFFEYVRLLEECKPTYFLLENVKMKKECQDIISGYLGVQPIRINSNLVSAQNRERLYWSNIPNIKQPKDNNIQIKDILTEDLNILIDSNKKYIKNTNKNTKKSLCILVGMATFKGKDRIRRVYNINGKSPTLTTFGASEIAPKIAISETEYRKLSLTECERLQTLPDNYTNYASDTQRYKMLGNCWTVDVVKHIFDSIPRTT